MKTLASRRHFDSHITLWLSHSIFTRSCTPQSIVNWLDNIDENEEARLVGVYNEQS